MLGNILLKQLLKRTLGDMPEHERQKVTALIEQNPELFTAIAHDAKAYMDTGVDQMTAITKAIQAREAELTKLTSHHGS